MSVDMSVSSSQSQAASVSAICQRQKQGYEQLQRSINDFVLSSPQLKGAAYESAKQFFSSVLIPLSKGGILLSEAVMEACQKFPEEYMANVDRGDLKESELTEKIEQLKRQMSELSNLQDRLQTLLFSQQQAGSLDGSIASRMSGNYSLMALYGRAMQKLEEKLAKSLAFNASSPAIFADITALEDAVAQGSAQVGQSWNSGTGVFNIPRIKDLEWMKTIISKFDEKEIDRISLKFPNSVSLDDLQKLADLQKRDLDKELPKRIKETLGAYGNDINDFLEKYSDQITIGRDFGWDLVEKNGYINFSAIGASISRIGLKNVGAVYSNSVPSIATYYNQVAFESASAHAATKMTSKVIGPAMIVLDFGLGMENDLDAGKTNGQAFTHNVASGGVGWGAGWLGATGVGAVAGFLGVSNPVGWVVVGGIGIGVVGGYVFDKVYDENLLGMKDGLDNIGEALDDVGNAINPMNWAW